jgi:hypothetical protein
MDEQFLTEGLTYDPIFNDEWFKDDISLNPSVVETMNNQMLSNNNDTLHEEGIDSQSEMISYFEKMQEILMDMENIKTRMASNESEPSVVDDDDYSDIDFFRENFMEDDVENTPVNWNNRASYRQGQNNVADAIYQTVLQATGNKQKAENAVKIAKHESSFNPQITNKYNMLGLFQFNPANQRKYGVTKNSSIEEQTLAWLKYQKDNNIPMGKEGVGQLAPAYINRDVIYKRGQKAYEANKKLDKNKDGVLSNLEINNWYGL